MALFESLFDVSYLIMVVALGVRLLLESKKGAKLFGIMAIILGVGDGFHLLPRIISHLSPGGFAANVAALSWGQFVTSITMTIFYLLYYIFYKRQSGSTSKVKDFLVYGLVIGRIILVLLPQNNWGQQETSYFFDILRNVPFAILGGLLIYWTWTDRNKEGLKYMAQLIFFSFLFYIPVVLFARFVPVVGALMMPKTIAYLLLVIVGFKYFVGEYKATSVLKTAVVFLIMGLVGGVFYREFTKYTGFTGWTTLSVLHTHALTVGFMMMIIIWTIIKDGDNNVLAKYYKKPLAIWTGGLYFTIVTMVVRGISQVEGNGFIPFKTQALSGIAGIGHILLGVGLVWTLLAIIKRQEQKTI